MSERLRRGIETVLTREGEAGERRLAKAADRSFKTLSRWAREGLPSTKDAQHSAYKLAKACGYSEEESLDIVREWSSEAARETA